MKIAAGVKAWWMVRDVWPMVLMIMDIESVVVKPKRRKMKKASASWRSFAMKYRGILKAKVDRILLGRSQIVEEIASEAG